MDKFAPNKYEKGIHLSLLLSEAIINLDLAEQNKPHNLESTRTIKNLLQQHLDRTQVKGSLDYQLEDSLRSALIFDVIPKIYGLKKGSSRYNREDYQTYLELALEQLNFLEEDKNPVRLTFAREFMIQLSNNRISRLELPLQYLAA